MTSPKRQPTTGFLLLAALFLLGALLLPHGALRAQEGEGETQAAAEPSQSAAEDAGAAEAETQAGEREVYAEDAAQEGDAAAALETFVDTVDVRVVNVDVYVTDKKGNRVTGLTRDDFELFEDGRPVELTNFYAVESGHPVREPAEDEAAQDAAGDEGEDGDAYPSLEGLRPLEQEPLPEDQRLFLVVYIDNFNIEPVHRNRVLDELGYFLISELDREDRVMLVTYERSLHVRRTFTADPDLVARALDEVARESGWGTNRKNARNDAMDRIRDARGPGQALSYARMHAEEMENDLRFTIGALKEMVGNLGGLPGRKALVYVSDGIPMVPGQDMFTAVDAKFGNGVASTDAFGYDASRQFTELASMANANRVTFYTIDAAGLRLASSFAAENRDPSLGLQIDSTYNSNHQTPLRYMAAETGGVAVLNTNNILSRMKTVAEDFDNFYSLGYSPPRAGSGRYHEIDVKVKGRKDLEVRHRQGYRDKTIQARMTDTTMSSLHYGYYDNPMDMDLTFGEAAQKDGRYFTVPVHVNMPIGDMVLVPRETTYEARLRLYIAAMDEQGDTSAVQQVPVAVSIPADEVERAKRQTYRYTVNLLMRPGPQKVAVGMRDEIASKESYVVETIYVGPRRKGG